MSADQPTPKSPAIRSLTISVMMSMLMAIVVFAICSMAFVFPQLGVLNLQLVAQQQRINALSNRVAALEAAAIKEPGVPAPAAPAAPAAAPQAVTP